ncbi:MAG TPA: response regulator transcription factor [Candidatus Baltobacteraceae bacterium]|jgi:DNA-binding NarL/FixJ family response regulator|nr:response regulator transcription factor [Candidatus Baltobacteraceae bacterium]
MFNGHQPVRIFIVEQQLLFGKAVAQVVSEDRNIVVAGIARNRESMDVKDGQVDVIIVDVDNDIDEIEIGVEHFRNVCPSAKICAISMYLQPELMQRCLSAGVDGYIVKDTSLQELIAAIKTLAEGTSYVDPRVAATLLRGRTHNQIPYNGELSPRETDIIRLIAQGLSNRDIGQRLVLSEKTVKNHVSRIFSKLHFTARSQAAVHAIRNGLA